MKKWILLLLIMALLFTSIPVMAAENPIIFKDVITVTDEGGRYQIGFVNIEFKKEFIDESKLPATFGVEVYAENGVAYIEFNPDTPDFFKKVHIRIDKYDGTLYDKATGENIEVHIDKQQIKAEHFSRYSFN
ncbi:MAG: hypothetical protein ACOYVK_08070 [Bacillota bacterium]